MREIGLRLADLNDSDGGALAARRVIGHAVNTLILVLARQLVEQVVIIRRRFGEVEGRRLLDDRAAWPRLADSGAARIFSNRGVVA